MQLQLDSSFLENYPQVKKIQVNEKYHKYEWIDVQEEIYDPHSIINSLSEATGWFLTSIPRAIATSMSDTIEKLIFSERSLKEAQEKVNNNAKVNEIQSKIKSQTETIKKLAKDAIKFHNDNVDKQIENDKAIAKKAQEELEKIKNMTSEEFDQYKLLDSNKGNKQDTKLLGKKRNYDISGLIDTGVDNIMDMATTMLGIPEPISNLIGGSLKPLIKTTGIAAGAKALQIGASLASKGISTIKKKSGFYEKKGEIDLNDYDIKNLIDKSGYYPTIDQTMIILSYLADSFRPNGQESAFLHNKVIYNSKLKTIIITMLAFFNDLYTKGVALNIKPREAFKQALLNFPGGTSPANLKNSNDKAFNVWLRESVRRYWLSKNPSKSSDQHNPAVESIDKIEIINE